MKDIKGRAVLVTGAASGIGRAVALVFAQEGASPLLLNDIDEEGLQETATAIEHRISNPNDYRPPSTG